MKTVNYIYEQGEAQSQSVDIPESDQVIEILLQYEDGSDQIVCDIYSSGVAIIYDLSPAVAVDPEIYESMLSFADSD